MTQTKSSTERARLQEALLDDPDFLRSLISTALQGLVDQEFTDHLGAAAYERKETRTGWRNGTVPRTLKTRVGTIELAIPRDRAGTFRTALFDRYQRSEKAFVQVMQEMVIQGVSTRKVTEVVETLCGTEVSPSFVSSVSSQLDEELAHWRDRPLTEGYPFLILDATYQKVRHAGRVVSQAVIVVTGVSASGQRRVLSVEVFHSENETEYRELLRRLKARGLRGVLMVVSDDHSGLRQAIQKELTDALWQRCQVHYTKNLLDKLRRRDVAGVKAMLRDAFDAPSRPVAEARLRHMSKSLRDLKYGAVADWLEESVPETLQVMNFPRGYFKRLRSTNSLERLNEELRRRVRVIRIFPNREACLRMNSALCQDQDEVWSTGKRYLDMSLLKEQDESAWNAGWSAGETDAHRSTADYTTLALRSVSSAAVR